jgi:hypothetical protein
LPEEFRDPLSGAPLPEPAEKKPVDQGGSGATGPEKEAGKEDKQREDDSPGEWKHVHSSNVLSYKYDHSERKLSIIFVGNRLYEYLNVPKDVAEQMGTASSVGKFVHHNIKNKYEFDRG